MAARSAQEPFKLSNLFRPFLQPRPDMPPQQPSSQRDFLEARQVSLFQLFDGAEFKFDIPVYQRPYSWGAKQVRELLRDFLTAYQSKGEFFLGSIVTTKNADGTYQVIDGQQRLTTLVMLLAYLKHWAAVGGNLPLSQRIEQMLYLPTDPLNTNSTARYRLQLRPADHPFFEANVLSNFLPTTFQRAGLLASSNYSAEAPTASTGAEGQAIGEPLDNEVWWRLQDNARSIAHLLDDLQQQDVNLQDLVFHCLHQCYVVMMVCRDEPSAFSIFSSLNSRGMDLTLTAKLKADILQVLSASEQGDVAERWAHWEAQLTQPEFDRLFKCLKALHASLDPDVAAEGLQEYYVRRARTAEGTREVLGVLMEYADTLLQLRSGSLFDPPATSPASSMATAATATTAAVTAGAAATTLPASPAGGSEASASTGNSSGNPESSAAAGAAAESSSSTFANARSDTATNASSSSSSATSSSSSSSSSNAAATTGGYPAGSEQAKAGSKEIAEDGRAVLFFLNALPDQSWLTCALEFCRQVADGGERVRFLRHLEALAVMLDLTEARADHRRERWRRLTAALATAGSGGEGGLAPVWDAAALTAEEAAEFRSRLDGQDLAAKASPHVLRHLLLRAEGLPSYKQVVWSQLHVEQMVPPSPPEGSTWRRVKLPYPAGATPAADPAAAAEGLALDSMDDAAAPDTAALDVVQPPAATATTAAAAAGAGAGAGTATVGTFKYWYELSRNKLVARLGNLVLLQYGGQERGEGDREAGYDEKAEALVSCGAAAFPRFTGGVLPGGRYGALKFSAVECKLRHAELVAALVATYGLK